MRRYETVFIFRPTLGEAQIGESLRRFEGIIANTGGELVDTDHWGIRELAYPIARERRGYYVRLDYCGGGPVMNELERNLKLSDDVLRYLSVLVQEEADAAALREEIEAHRRRAVEATEQPRAQDEARAEASEQASAPQPASAEAPAGGTEEAAAEPQGDTRQD